MIELQIGENKCSIPNEWNEIDLNTYKDLVRIIYENDFKEPNDELREQDKEVVDVERQMSNIKLNRKILSYLTKIDESVINKCNILEMNNALKLMTEFLNTQAETKYNNKVKFKFDFKGKTYYFPEMKMHGSTFGDYIESAQLEVLAKKSEGGRMSVVAEQMAVLCREENEKYNEEKVLKKTKIFGKLKMDIVWDFLFFLTKQINTYRKNILTSLKAGNEITTDTQPNIGKS